jgi:hypothetical protein
MVKGTDKLTRKLVGMESRHPLAETSRSVGLVHLVNPKLTLHLMDDVNKRVGVHNVKKASMVEVERWGIPFW